MKYYITVTEHSVAHFLIEANTPEEAQDFIADKYNAAEIVLDSSDFEEVTITFNGIEYNNDIEPDYTVGDTYDS